MFNRKLKKYKQFKRHKRIRTKIKGTPGRPRISLYCSHKNLYAQLIDDTKHRTLLSVSTRDKEIKEKAAFGGNIAAAKLLGEWLSKKAKEKSITKAVLDKGPYLYHGRVKTFSESARAGGLEF